MDSDVTTILKGNLVDVNKVVTNCQGTKTQVNHETINDISRNSKGHKKKSTKAIPYSKNASNY